MPQADAEKPEDSLRRHLEEVQELLEKQYLEEVVVDKRPVARQRLIQGLLHRQHQVQLKHKLAKLHAADIAYILNCLPLKERLDLWDQVNPEMEGDILLEVSDAVRETLLSDMEHHEILSAAGTLETDEIADIAEDLPKQVMEDILESLNEQSRQRLESVLGYDEDSVGALMDFNMVTVREDISLKAVMRYCRRLGSMPEHTNQFFVIDRNNILRGLLSLQSLLVHSGKTTVGEVMSTEIVSFKANDDAGEAARAFDRYELVSAPVVDEQDKLVGRVAVDAIVNYMRQHSEEEMLSQAGFIEGEDLFSGIWKGAKNRWFWLMINIVTAFCATRVIGLFEETIIKLVALASLMPIVAAVGGNTGHQTSILMIRSLALGQITSANVRKLFLKEMGIGMINGLLWGNLVAIAVFFIYRDFPLGTVMGCAVWLNLLLAALIGFSIPLLRYKFNLDPAVGTSVLLTFLADGLGFFIFLGLATAFLV